jgi:acetyl-CoA carboxylase biotin carboxyl carrier protein
MAENDIDIKKLQELIEIMKTNSLEELEINQGESKIFLKRSSPQNLRQPMAAPPIFIHGASSESAPAQLADASAHPAGVKDKNLIEIKSPIVGTFYAKPSPDAESYVEIGSKVDARTVVCIIEAMKVMNEIRAETDGTIVECCVNNGQAVEYGQVLFKVKPD